VDRDQRREAREIIDAETPLGTRPDPIPRDDEPSRGLSDVDEERAWREIVSAWDSPAVEPIRGPGPHPPAPDSPGPPDRPGGPPRAGTSGVPADPDAGDRPADRDDPPTGAGPGGPRSQGGPGGPRSRGGPRRPRGPDGADPPGSQGGPESPGGWRGPNGDDWPGGPGGPDRDGWPGGQGGPDDPGDQAGPDGDGWLGGPGGRRGPGAEGRRGRRPAEDPDVIGTDLPGGRAAGRRGGRRGGKHAAGGPRSGLRWRPWGAHGAHGADDVPTGADLDRAAEARARAEQDAEDELWLDGPPAVDEGHYEPPPPPPVPRLSRPALLGVLVVVFGILLLGAPSIVGLDDRTGLTFGVLAILGGSALLVLRLRETRADDGPDDGAVV
jgi:hypothetical protein